MERAYTRTVEALVEHFRVDPKLGLTEDAVVESRRRFGRNLLLDDPPTPVWKLVLEQFKDKLVIILLAAAAISLGLALVEGGDDNTAFVDPVVILVILVLNAVVGVSQEVSAEAAISALSEYSPDETKVLRSGRLQKIRSEDLVPGDIIEISVGDKIPADSRLTSIESNSFRVDQAILTGESQSVDKGTSLVQDPKAVKQDQTNMLFSGTTVTIGRARAIVVLTGASTAIGDIHHSISSQISQPTPLKEKLNDFGDMLAKVITVICILVWVVNYRNFWDPSHKNALQGAIYYFKIAVALAVAAIPEGLAVVITTCLALGTRKMAAKNAIVRSLPSVETLGSTSVICSDKTGTLTTNQMSVCRIVIPAEQQNAVVELEIDGTTYAPQGSVRDMQNNMIDMPATQFKSLSTLAAICAICNDAEINYDASTNTYHNVGEPTEAALKTLVEKLGHDQSSNSKEFTDPANRAYIAAEPRRATFEFSRDRKMMSVVIDTPMSGQKLYVKGAPEAILAKCNKAYVGSQGRSTTLDDATRSLLEQKVAEFGSDGLRVIGFAVKEYVEPIQKALADASTEEYSKLESNMTFVGIVGMLDPPRAEVPEAIRKCRSAGIRVIVITGDNQQTAETICRRIGVFGSDEDLAGKSYTGREFDDLSESAKVEAVCNASLFSRTEPIHKTKLISLLQKTGAVVAMTGDGVNDAPALKIADIGVAMGSGTDVAKLAADMVLADDNFATIEVAVEEGRSIYNNTQQFIRYLISSNIGEVVSIFLTVLLGMPEALIPVQLLWVNLVTDGLPATALGFNPPDNAIMERPPRRRDEPLVTRWLFFRYMVIGAYVGLATVAGYIWWFLYYPAGPRITYHQLTRFHECSTLYPSIDCSMFSGEASHRASTVSLSILVVIEMMNAMNALSQSESLLTLPIWRNMKLVYAICLSMVLHFTILYTPFLQQIFSIVPLNWDEWRAVLIISAPIMY